jgi:hypothetical protein
MNGVQVQEGAAFFGWVVLRWCLGLLVPALLVSTAPHTKPKCVDQVMCSTRLRLQTSLVCALATFAVVPMAA